MSGSFSRPSPSQASNARCGPVGVGGGRGQGIKESGEDGGVLLGVELGKIEMSWLLALPLMIGQATVSSCSKIKAKIGRDAVALSGKLVTRMGDEFSCDQRNPQRKLGMLGFKFPADAVSIIESGLSGLLVVTLPCCRGEI